MLRISQADISSNFLISPLTNLTVISLMLFLFYIDSMYLRIDKLKNLQFLDAHIASQFAIVPPHVK
jgi:hypothetical protein